MNRTPNLSYDLPLVATSSMMSEMFMCKEAVEWDISFTTYVLNVGFHQNASMSACDTHWINVKQM